MAAGDSAIDLSCTSRMHVSDEIEHITKEK